MNIMKMLLRKRLEITKSKHQKTLSQVWNQLSLCTKIK